MFKAVLLLALCTCLFQGIFSQSCAPGDTLCAPASGPSLAPSAVRSALATTAFTPVISTPATASIGAPTTVAKAPPKVVSVTAPPAVTPTVAAGPISSLGSGSVGLALSNDPNFTDPAYNNIIKTQASSGGSSSCGDLTPSALQTLEAFPETLYFRKMINQVNTSASPGSQLYIQLLQQNTNVTIFAPTNLAIEKWCNQTFPGQAVTKCISDPQNGRMVEYLILQGQYTLETIKASKPTFESLTYLSQGTGVPFAKCGDITQSRIRATTNSTGSYLQGSVGTAFLNPDTSNQQGCGTIIHIISQVLTPCPFSGPTQTQGCGGIFDSLASKLGRDNTTYRNYIQNTKVFQTVMQDPSWVGTAFMPTLNAMKKFIDQMTRVGVISGAADPNLTPLLDQVLRLHFSNMSMVFVSNANQYTGGGVVANTVLATGAQRQKNVILLPTMLSNFTFCPGVLNTTQTYITVTLSDSGSANAQVADYGYSNVTAQISTPDLQGCSAVVQIIDNVLQPCSIQPSNQQVGVPVFGAPASSLSGSTPGSSSGSQFNSLKGSDSRQFRMRPVFLIMLLLTLVLVLIQ